MWGGCSSLVCRIADLGLVGQRQSPQEITHNIGHSKQLWANQVIDETS